MFHLFKHTSGALANKYDIALVVNGKFIMGSNQGYEKKQGCYKAIRAMIKTVEESYAAFFQDDTLYPPSIMRIHKTSGLWIQQHKKPSKPYIPNKK